MLVHVHARPGAREEMVEEMEPGRYKVWVREPAKNGLANRAIRRVLAEHFCVAEDRVKFISGGASSRKVFLVE